MCLSCMTEIGGCFAIVIMDGNWDLKQKCDAEGYFPSSHMQAFLSPADKFIGTFLWFLENKGLNRKNWLKHEDYDHGWTIQHDGAIFSPPFGLIWMFKAQRIFFCDLALHKILTACSKYVHWHAYSYILGFNFLIGKVPLQHSGIVKLQHRHHFQGLLIDV